MLTGNTEPRQIKTWDEQDVHSGWRKVLRLPRGYTKWVKRQTNRRERRARKQQKHDEM